MVAQSVITRETIVAEGVFAPGHLGELTQLVPFEMVDEALAETRTVQCRIRDLPSRVGGLPPAGGGRAAAQRALHALFQQDR